LVKKRNLFIVAITLSTANQLYNFWLAQIGNWKLATGGYITVVIESAVH